MTEVELETSRRLTRRRFAVQSFYSLLIFGGAIIILGLSNDQMADRIVKMTGVIGVVLGAFVATLATYMASSAYEHKGN